jgi:hypothetical protein
MELKLVATEILEVDAARGLQAQLLQAHRNHHEYEKT